VERIHAGSQLGGQLEADVDSVQGQFGTVGGQQDVLEHGELLYFLDDQRQV
jgi:hypothetical protein